jgi:hypothetical protein
MVAMIMLILELDPVVLNRLNFGSIRRLPRYFVLASTSDYILVRRRSCGYRVYFSNYILSRVATTTLIADQWQHGVTSDTAENASNLNIGRTADTNYLR